jgi:hypothetical protein
MSRLARALSHQQNYAEAATFARQALDGQRRTLGPGNPDTALSLYTLAGIEARSRNREEALRLVSEAIAQGAPAPDDLGLAGDPDLKSLHGDPQFRALLQDAGVQAARRKAR